jgi:hypothetical protein
MRLNIDIALTPAAEHEIRVGNPDLEQIAKEAFLVELYRQHKLRHKQLAEALGLNRWKTEEVLHHYGVVDATPADLDREDAGIRRRLGLS